MHIAATESVSLCERMKADGVCGTGIGDSRLRQIASPCQGRADVPLAASLLSSTRMKCIGLSPMFSAAWVKGSR
jgi:hypothetical protein